MSSNSNTYSVSNEHILLVDILNGMYNDNLRQINNFTNSINNLNETNTQIRNVLIQILNNQNNQNRRNNNGRNERRNGRINRNINQPSNNSGLGIILNNDNIQQHINPSNRNESQNNDFSRMLQNFFQPVEIYPTQTQIELSTRRVRYCDIISPRNISCPISLDVFNDNDIVIFIRHCRHIFNSEELNTWFSSNCRCPVCRYDIRNYNSNASSETNEITTPSTISLRVTNNEQNNSLEINEERRNTQINTNQNNDASNILNIFSLDVSSQGLNRNNIIYDSSENSINNLLNEAITDPDTLYNLLSNFNNRTYI